MAETEAACAMFIPLDGSGGIFFFASSVSNLFFLEGENLRCLQNFVSPNSAAARHNVKIPVGFSRFCTRLAEFFAVLVEISASTADFCGCGCRFLWVFVPFRESVFRGVEFY